MIKVEFTIDDVELEAGLSGATAAVNATNAETVQNPTPLTVEQFAADTSLRSLDMYRARAKKALLDQLAALDYVEIVTDIVPAVQAKVDAKKPKLELAPPVPAVPVTP